jgi:hypothetical protein
MPGLKSNIAGTKMQGMDLDLAQELTPKDGWIWPFNSGNDT